jgi:hypothetical protein
VKTGARTDIGARRLGSSNECWPCTNLGESGGLYSLFGHASFKIPLRLVLRQLRRSRMSARALKTCLQSLDG